MSAVFPSSFPGRPVARFLPNPKLRLLDQCREVLRFKQMSPRTEEAYVHWISTAKREETRRRRLSEAVELIERNVKFPHDNG